MASISPQSEGVRLTGGADGWDDGLAGTLLSLDYFATIVPINGQIKTYIGEAFQAKPVKVWDGTLWKSAKVKTWDGLQWNVTPY